MSDGIKKKSRKESGSDRTEAYVGCNNYKNVGGRKRYKVELFEIVLDSTKYVWYCKVQYEEKQVVEGTFY